MLDNHLSDYIQGLLSSRCPYSEDALRIARERAPRVKNMALGWAIVAGLFCPIVIAIILAPLFFIGVTESVFARVFVTALLIIGIYVFASAAYGALLHVFARAELSISAAKRGLSK